MARLTILPDPRFEPLQTALHDRLTRVGQLITPDNFVDLLSPLALNLLLDAFSRARAHEGTIWLVDAKEECLTPAYNNGPNAEKMRGFRQSLRKGLVSMVFANEQPFVMNSDTSEHDHTLSSQLHVQIHAMIVLPFYFLGQCRGVITCVQLQRFDGDTPVEPVEAPGLSGFEAEDLGPVQRAADILRALIDAQCLAKIVGLSL